MYNQITYMHLIIICTTCNNTHYLTIIAFRNKTEFIIMVDIFVTAQSCALRGAGYLKTGFFADGRYDLDPALLDVSKLCTINGLGLFDQF